jgi:hypothetical protein
MLLPFSVSMVGANSCLIGIDTVSPIRRSPLKRAARGPQSHFCRADRKVDESIRARGEQQRTATPTWTCCGREPIALGYQFHRQSAFHLCPAIRFGASIETSHSMVEAALGACQPASQGEHPCR